MSRSLSLSRRKLGKLTIDENSWTAPETLEQETLSGMSEESEKHERG